MEFTAEQRAQMVAHCMAERGIDSLAELARRAGCDPSNAGRFLGGERGVLGPSARARVAEALGIEQPQFALLYDYDVIVVPLDAWIAVQGHGDDVDERREDQVKARERREQEPKGPTLPGPRPRW